MKDQGVKSFSRPEQKRDSLWISSHELASKIGVVAKVLCVQTGLGLPLGIGSASVRFLELASLGLAFEPASVVSRGGIVAAATHRFVFGLQT